MLSYRQRDASDCGAACFSFVAASFGLHLPIALVRQRMGSGKAGTSASALMEMAQRMGISAKGVKGPADALPAVPLPAIAHCLVDGKLLHYVVLLEWSSKSAKVMDPLVGRVESWPHERFRAVWTGVLILLAPGEKFRPGDHTISPIARLWHLLSPHKAVLWQAVVGSAVATLLGLGMAAYVQNIVDNVLPDGNRQLLNVLSVAMLAMLVFRLAFGALQALLSIRTAQRIDATLLLGYYRHLLRLPQTFFDTTRVGEITSRVGDAVRIRNFLNNSLPDLLLNPLVIMLSLGAMFAWSWKLALLSLVLVPVNSMLYWAMNRLNRTFQRRVMERTADLDSHLVESLSAQPLLRSQCLEEHTELRLEIRLVRLLKTSWRATLAGLGTGTFGTLITQIYMIGLLWFGTALVIESQLTPGQLMSCYTLAGFLAAPTTALLGTNAAIQDVLIATDRLFEIMDLELERDQGTVELGGNHAAGIRFEQVTFRYPGRTNALSDLNFEIPAGRITAITGESGCGKTTLLSLIHRLYAPDRGRILIGGQDIQCFRLGSLRRHVAVVPQHTRLLSGTVLDNLAPGDSEPDMDRILRLCHEVGALAFIEKLPHGFFSQLSEDGANLSGGQRQRLALARALYVGAPYMLLDEPDCALDSTATDAIVRLLRNLCMRGRTILVATHSAPLLSAAHVVVTLDAGRLVSVDLKGCVPSPRCAGTPDALTPAVA